MKMEYLNTVEHYTVRYYTVQYYTVQFYTVQYYTVQYGTVPSPESGSKEKYLETGEDTKHFSTMKMTFNTNK